ncbi:lipopolysaccharide biosynthesis protein [Vibrio splendidus]
MNDNLRKFLHYLFAQGVPALLGFVALTYISNSLGEKKFGELSIYLMILQVSTVVIGLNTPNVMQRIFFKLDKEDSSRVLLSFILLSLFMLCLLIVISMLCFEFISTIYTFLDINLLHLVLLGGLLTAVSNLVTKYNVFQEESTIILTSNIMRAVVNNLGSVMIYIVFKPMIWLRIIAYVVGYFISVIMQFKKINIRFSKVTEHRNDIFSNLKFIFPSFILSFTAILISSADRIIIESHFGLEQLGIYTLAFLVGQSISLVFDASFNAMLPKFMMSVKDKDFVKANSYVKYFDIISFTMGVLSLVFGIIYYSYFASDGFSQGMQVYMLFVIALTFGARYKLANTVVIHDDYYWYSTVSSIVCSLVALCMSYSLIPKIGLMMAPISMLTQVSLYSFLVFIHPSYRSRIPYSKFQVFTVLLSLSVVIIYLGISLHET